MPPVVLLQPQLGGRLHRAEQLPALGRHPDGDADRERRQDVSEERRGQQVGDRGKAVLQSVVGEDRVQHATCREGESLKH